MKRLQQHQKALGSEVLLTLVGENEAALVSLYDELWREIMLFEATFSRFLPDSELTYVNQRAGQQVMVSPEFVALARATKAMSAATQGIYNPFILPKLQAVGYKGSWPDPGVYDAELDYEQRAIVPADSLEIGDGWVNIPPDSALDFGGIGKGYLLDQLAKLLDPKLVKGYWFSLGGDIVCGGVDVGGQPWRIGLQRADSEAVAGYVENKDGKQLAVATSGITKRRGSGWHHIIDPRTGQSAKTDVLTASICMSNGLEADVFAKCLVILGNKAAEDFAAANNITAKLLQIRDDKGTVTVHKTGDIQEP